MNMRDIFFPNKYGVSVALAAYVIGAAYSAVEQLSYCRAQACSAPAWLIVAGQLIAWLPVLIGAYLLTNAVIAVRRKARPKNR